MPNPGAPFIDNMHMTATAFLTASRGPETAPTTLGSYKCNKYYSKQLCSFARIVVKLRRLLDRREVIGVMHAYTRLYDKTAISIVREVNQTSGNGWAIIRVGLRSRGAREQIEMRGACQQQQAPFPLAEFRGPEHHNFTKLFILRASQVLLQTMENK